MLPDQLAPITRIGGGEVRVDRALFSPVIVSDVTGDKVSKIHGAMSFGYLDASKTNQVLHAQARGGEPFLLPAGLQGEADAALPG